MKDVDPAERVSVREAFTALFRQPGWVRTLLLGTACMFVPFAGQLVVQGYAARVLRHVAFTGGPIPAMGGPVQYLREGLLPFIGSLVWTFPVTIAAYVLALVAAAIGTGAFLAARLACAAAGLDPGAIGTISTLIGVAAGLLGFALGLVALLAVVRHGRAADTLVELTGELRYAWSFRPVRAYLAVLGPEGRRAFACMILGNVVVLACGMLLCGLGVVFMPFVQAFSAAHLEGQLHRLYLSRGGAPLPPAVAPGGPQPAGIQPSPR